MTSNSPPECPRSSNGSVKRQAPKPPPPPPSSAIKRSPPEQPAAAVVVVRQHASAAASTASNDGPSSDDQTTGPGDVTAVNNRKLLAEYCEQIEMEQQSSHGNRNCDADRRPCSSAEQDSGGEFRQRESSTLPLATKRQPACDKKKCGKAGRMGLKIKKFLRIPGRGDSAGPPAQPSPRPKLEIIHPLDINKSAVEIIHGAAAAAAGPLDLSFAAAAATKGGQPSVTNHYARKCL